MYFLSNESKNLKLPNRLNMYAELYKSLIGYQPFCINYDGLNVVIELSFSSKRCIFKSRAVRGTCFLLILASFTFNSFSSLTQYSFVMLVTGQTFYFYFLRSSYDAIIEWIVLKLRISAFLAAVNPNESWMVGSTPLSIRQSIILTFHFVSADIKGVFLNLPAPLLISALWRSKKCTISSLSRWQARVIALNFWSVSITSLIGHPAYRHCSSQLRSPSQIACRTQYLKLVN